MELTLEQKVERLQDTQKVKNLMSSYSYYQYAHEHTKVLELFSKRDDAFVDSEGMGIYEGQSGLKRFLVDWQWQLDGDAKGSYNEHFFTTEVVEVAKDGKTARGLWMSPGCETRRVKSKNGGLEAFWVWCKYAVDFIKEDGEWKIWHMRIPYDVICDYHHSWVDEGCIDYVTDIMYDGEKPTADRPSGFEPTLFSQEKVTNLFFAPPSPYETEADIQDLWKKK